MIPRPHSRSSRDRLAFAALGAALVVAALLRWSPLGPELLQARGVHAWRTGRTGEAVAHLSAAARDGGTAESWTRLGIALGRTGAPEESRPALVRGTLAADSAVRADAWHALSALHLSPGPAGTGARTGPGTPGAGADPGRASVAARAAMEALRLRPGHGAVAWNLYLARTSGGFPEPETAPETVDARTARMLRTGLAAAEARTLQASLGAILNELEARRPPPSVEGPPW